MSHELLINKDPANMTSSRNLTPNCSGSCLSLELGHFHTKTVDHKSKLWTEYNVDYVIKRDLNQGEPGTSLRQQISVPNFPSERRAHSSLFCPF